MDAEHPPERNESLWILTAAPAIWAVHLLLCYLTAALWCGMVVGRDGSLGTARAAIAGYTAIAVIGIGAIGWVGYRRHSYGGATAPHDFDTPEDRHRFLGFATLLLSVLSAVATIYVALTVVFIGSCN
jgi:hypothetical protein